jgi:hypothetical protein
LVSIEKSAGIESSELVRDTCLINSPWIQISLSALYSVAANYPHNCLKLIAIEALAGNDPISRIVVREEVSRKFLYLQKQKAEAALDQAFSSGSGKRLSPPKSFRPLLTDGYNRHKNEGRSSIVFVTDNEPF